VRSANCSEKQKQKKNKKENTLARRKNKQKQSKSENCALSDAERERERERVGGGGAAVGVGRRELFKTKTLRTVLPGANFDPKQATTCAALSNIKKKTTTLKEYVQILTNIQFLF